MRSAEDRRTASGAGHGIGPPVYRAGAVNPALPEVIGPVAESRAREIRGVTPMFWKNHSANLPVLPLTFGQTASR